MPRLSSKKQELYCYARAYNAASKSAALRFAGYAVQGANFLLEDKPHIAARIEEMKETPQLELYQGQFAAEVDKASQLAKAQYGLNINQKWFMEELYENVVLARSQGKIKEATEALKAMAVIFQKINAVSPRTKKDAALDHRITRLIDEADSESRRLAPFEVQEEPGGAEEMGDAFGGDDQTEDEIEIVGPGES